MTFGSLFSGVGGIDLGLERAGMECLWQVENDPYCQKVLARHWPQVKRYGDIRKLAGSELEPVDLICGGFPCQDLSQAGKRAGIEGTRSGLWFEFARLVGELGPRWVLIENVSGLLVHDAIRRVIGELARLGYVGCYRSLRAADFGASHLRKRVFIVAYRTGGRLGELRQPPGRDGLVDGRHAQLADTPHNHGGQRIGRTQTGTGSNGIGWRRSASRIGVLADASGAGLPDTESLFISGPQRRNEGRAAPELCGALLRFAPGPADPRWPDILAARPDLAPALAYTGHAKRKTGGSDSNTSTGETVSGYLSGEPSRSEPAPSDEPRATPPQSEIRGMADGIPDWLDGAMSNRTRRLGRLGNAVVPDCAEWIARKILEFDHAD